MAIFNSAGHSNSDPGAIGNGHKEADLTKEFRDMVNNHLKQMGANVISDIDSESLAQYLNRIKPGTSSVVHETHFNAATPQATGVEVIIPNRYTQQEFDCAREIAAAISTTTGLVLRGNKGVKTESETHRGSLALMRKEGLNVLTEICFISNATDLHKYFAVKNQVAKQVATILKKYDDMM